MLLLIFVFCFWVVGDVFSTKRFLKHPFMEEANPMARYLIDKIGLKGIFIIKTVIIVIFSYNTFLLCITGIIGLYVTIFNTLDFNKYRKILIEMYFREIDLLWTDPIIKM
jgi:hypothetical protein